MDVETILRIDQDLLTGDNYFWISTTLDVSADLNHKIGIQCDAVVLDNKTILVDQGAFRNPKLIGIALRKHGDDQVHTYRIPGLVTTNRGTLIGVYDLRYNSPVDLQEDIDIGMSRSTDRGNSWEPMKIIMDMAEWGGKPQIQNGIGDPSILVDRKTNTIWVAGIWAHGHPGKRNWHASKPGLLPTETSQLMLTKSEDDGLTWSDPINITPLVKKPEWHLLLQGPGKGISLKDGTLVFPAQYKDENQIPHATILYSKDHGKTWQLGNGAKSKTTESQVVQLNDGALMLNMRDDRGRDPIGNGYRSVAITYDLGETWIEHPTSRKALTEPVCNASLIKHAYQMHGEERSVMIFANPANQYERKDMTIKLSFDEGMTWPDSSSIVIDEGTGRGYPSLTSIDEYTLGILYEGSQADLVFQKIPLALLFSKD